MSNTRTIYKNITSAATTDIIEKGKRVSGNIKNISINNTGSNSTLISVFIDDGTNEFYFCKATILPAHSNLVLTDNISFDSSVYDLKITTSGTSPNLTVIIK